MKIAVVNARDMTEAAWNRWRFLQAGNPELDSPYFSADYVRIAASVRNDVFVALLGPPDEPEGFFAYQLGKMRAGHPVGSRLSDFQGVVASAGFAVDVPELMRACKLASWEYNGLLASQASFAPFNTATVGSHYLDTSGGAPGYEEARRRAGSDQPRRLRSYRKKANEKFKKVEFVPHVTDTRVLDTLLEWKSKQYRESGTVDNWSFDWMRDFVRRIHAHQGEEFSGTLSALYFDGELAVVHMGMRSRTAWHWWFPRHSEQFADMRPGLLLLHHMIEHSPQFGVKRIDLGYGDEEYKMRLRSGEIPVAQGRVEMPSLSRSLRRWREGVESWVRKSPLYPVVRFPGRVLKRIETWNRYR
jgi:CelD/BcsL family acetyltransferase involved in cellulose biosynthesis